MCTHSIVSRCVLSPLSPFLFCFHLPPASTSLRTLLNILLSSTSCVSSALGTNRVCLSHYINDMVRNSFVCLDSAKLTLDPKIADHCGLLGVVIGLAEMKFHCKTAYSYLSQSICPNVYDMSPISWPRGPLSPSQPSYPFYPVLPRGPCGPPRPHSRHRHTHGFDNK